MSLQDLVKPLIDPALLLFALSLVLVLGAGRWRALRVLFVLIFYLAAIPLTGHLIARAWVVPDSDDGSQRYAAVMPLAGALSLHRLEDPQIAAAGDPALLLDENVARLLAAIGVVREGRAEVLLYGDARIEDRSEAEVARAFCLASGLTADQVRVLGRVRRTLEEAREARRYLDRIGGGRLLLVTSALHMRRARALFRAQGVAPATFSVQRPGPLGGAAELVPDLDGLRATRDVLYELVAYAGYALTGRL